MIFLTGLSWNEVFPMFQVLPSAGLPLPHCVAWGDSHALSGPVAGLRVC